MQKDSGQSLTVLSPARRRLYVTMTFVFLLLLLTIIEIGLRIFNYRNAKPLLVSIPDERSKYYGINPDTAKRYFTKLSDVPTPGRILQETAFAYQWIGQVYLLSHDIEKGITFLEKARQKDPLDTLLQYDLGRAYFNTSQSDKGNEILGHLKYSSADLSLISRLEECRKLSLVN